MENTEKQYTVLIADDHDGVRKGIRNIIERVKRFQVVGEAKDGKEALRLTQKIAPDLLLLDVQLPLLRGEEVAKRVSSSNPEVKILALSSFDNSEYITTMIENGASGYLTKDEAPALLIDAAMDILENQATEWISENLIRETGINLQNKLVPEVTLTHIELQILEYLKEGMSETEIAEELEFSNMRLSKYIQILLLKYDVGSLQELLEII